MYVCMYVFICHMYVFPNDKKKRCRRVRIGSGRRGEFRGGGGILVRDQ